MHETIYTKYGHIQLGNEFIHIEDDQYRRDMRRATFIGAMGFLLSILNLYKEWPDIYEGLSIVYVAVFIVSLISLPFHFLLTYQKNGEPGGGKEHQTEVEPQRFLFDHQTA